MMSDEDEYNEVEKSRAQAIELLKSGVGDERYHDSTMDRFGRIRERLIDQVIMLGENIPTRPTDNAKLEVSSQHATAIAAYLEAVTMIDGLIDRARTRFS